MKNRFTINLFIEKKDEVSRINFSIELDKYDTKTIEKLVSQKLALNEKKWTIETSEQIELVEKERVIFWKTKLKGV